MIPTLDGEKLHDAGNAQPIGGDAILFARITEIYPDGTALATRLNFNPRTFLVFAHHVERLGLRVGDLIQTSHKESGGLARANTKCEFTNWTPPYKSDARKLHDAQKQQRAEQQSTEPRTEPKRAHRGYRGGRGRMASAA